MTRILPEIECGKVKRRTFSKIKEAIELPYLVKIQKDSYDAFIKEGISEVLEDYENKVICENDENGLYNSLKEHLMNENDVKKPYVYNNKIIEKIKKIL